MQAESKFSYLPRRPREALAALAGAAILLFVAWSIRVLSHPGNALSLPTKLLRISARTALMQGTARLYFLYLHLLLLFVSSSSLLSFSLLSSSDFARPTGFVLLALLPVLLPPPFLFPLLVLARLVPPFLVLLPLLLEEQSLFSFLIVFRVLHIGLSLNHIEHCLLTLLKVRMSEDIAVH